MAVTGGRIAYAGPGSGFDRRAVSRCAGDPTAARQLTLPGLVDLHCHGAAGGGFPTATTRRAGQAVDFLHRNETTTLLASLVTASGEELLRPLGVLRALTADGLIAGIHAEGPFLSHARCGAQNPRWLRDPIPNCTPFPSRRISPWSGTTAPVRALIKVDLPAPLSPITARISPGKRSKSA